MRKRMKKKEEKKAFRKVYEAADATEITSTTVNLPTPEDLALIVRVMKQEFDASPEDVMRAEIMLPYYAWWHVLESYFEQEGLPFTKHQTSAGRSYAFEGGEVGVRSKGQYLAALDGPHTRAITLLYQQKDYERSSDINEFIR